MSSLQIDLDPTSINARIKAIETQLVDSGALNAELRELYMSIYHGRILGNNVEESLAALEQEIAERSLKSRLGVQQIVEFLLGQDPSARLDHFLPIFPDYYTEHGPFWNFQLRTPLKWADYGSQRTMLTRHNHWVPPTRWSLPQPFHAGVTAGAVKTQAAFSTHEILQPSSSRSLVPSSLALNPVSAPFVPRGNELARPDTFQTFTPSRVVLGQPRLLSAELVERARDLGYHFNENYEGEIDAYALRNASCPPDQNCSVFIAGIHADVTTPEFFQMIMEGPVFSMHMKRPTSDIDTCAVSLVFTTREAAEAFVQRSSTVGIFLRGNRLKVIWNRERARPVAGLEAHQTRVLQIIGPDNQITIQTILEHLKPLVNFETSHIRNWAPEQGVRVYEIGFASVRGQSRLAMRALYLWLQEFPSRDQWRVTYAPDPCDRRPPQLQY